MAILSVNAGSSSLKFSVHPVEGGVALGSELSGIAEGLEPGGRARLKWSGQGFSGEEALGSVDGDAFGAALASVRRILAAKWQGRPMRAVAHRVVHGGAEFSKSVEVDAKVMGKLRALSSLAPLHQPRNLDGVEACSKAFPELAQVACFDTAFHSAQPKVERSFALPREIEEMGVRRYGFHGLSYQRVSGLLERLSEKGRGRVLMAHLGNGASLCAAVGGASVASTMGFSALDGLMMGTRCGSIDPGVMLHLMSKGWDATALEKLLYKKSGLLGVSGVSADMRELRASKDPAAAFAIEMFAHRIARESGAMCACMGGIDLFAFSGGIGEHDVALRLDLGRRMSWLGVEVDEALNAQAVGSKPEAIHSATSRVEVWVVPTDEGLVAASEALALLSK